MADGKGAAISFDDIIQEGRKKRQAEKLAQEIFGKGRRSSAPPAGPKVGLGGSLASRVGVNKRTPSIPRAVTPRQPRPAPPLRPASTDTRRPRPSYTQPLSDPAIEAKSNGLAQEETADAGDGLSIRGAASGPYTVIAQNFVPGTTAADIESVMFNVGGDMTSCKLIASNPTVIAEMNFVDRAGAEKVIETFNGKKADGRPLYVYSKYGSGTSRANTQARRQPVAPEPPTPALVAGAEEDVVMEVDENAESRAAADRVREERRGRDDRRDVLPTGPKTSRNDMDSYYDRRPRPSERNYQDDRRGFAGGGGYRDSGRGRYAGNDRRWGGGQSWRP